MTNKLSFKQMVKEKMRVSQAHAVLMVLRDYLNNGMCGENNGDEFNRELCKRLCTVVFNNSNVIGEEEWENGDISCVLKALSTAVELTYDRLDKYEEWMDVEIDFDEVGV